MIKILLTLFIFLVSTNCWSATFDYYATSAPSNCALGEMWFDSDATQGYNVNVCTATDTWTPLFSDISNNTGMGTSSPSGALVVMNGNVGIGTWSPRSGFEIGGAGTIDNATTNIDAYVKGKVEADGGFYGDGSGLTNVVNTSGWTDSGAIVYQSATTDFVGIGTTNPSTTLEIVKQSTNVPLMVSSSAAGDGDYVIVASSGNVGIGSVSPNAQMAIFQATPSLDTLRLINADAGNLGPTLSFVQNSASPATFDELGRVSFLGNNDTPSRREFARISVHNLDPSAGFEEGRYVFSVMRSGILRDIISTNSSFVGINTSSPQATLSVSGSAVIGAGYASQFSNTGNGIYVQGNTGIGTMAPASLLSIAGGATVGLTYARQVAPTDGLIVQGNVGIGTTAAAEKFVMPVGNMGIGTLNPVGGLIVMSGNAGIGTWSPISRLEVRGGDLRLGSGTFDNASASDDAYVTGNLEVDGTLFAASSSIASAAGWTDSGAIVYQSATTDFVGIGTTNPSTTLEILQQGTNPSFMVSSVFNGDGNLMIVHSGGNVGIGTTQPIAKSVIENTGAIDSFRVNDITADPAPFIIDQNGNVGIGTTMSVNTLSVNGAAVIGSGAAYETLTAPSNGLMVEGNVGIGTFVPGGTLEVITASTIIPFMVSSTSITNGDYLVVTSVGNVGVGTNAPNTKFAVIGGNVGIGTTLSNNNILSVNGGAYIAGNVGIGTLYPSGGGIMDIRRDEVRIWTGGGVVDNITAAGELYVEGDLEVDGTLYAASASIASAAGWTDGGAIVFQTATTDFVGIGTTNPSTTLEILQQGTNPSLMVSSVFNGDGNLMIVHSGGNVGIGTTQPIAKTVIENTGAIDSFRVNDITADSAPFIIDQNGNVGIGTSTSSVPLTVLGGNVGIGIAGADQPLVVSPAANAQAVIGIRSTGGAGAAILMGSGGAYTGGIGFGQISGAGSGLDFRTNGTAAGNIRMIIDNNGNVGIGTTLSNTALSVNGGAYIAGNVGIGTLYPSTGGILDIRQDEVRIWDGTGTNTNAVSEGELYVQGDLEVDGTIYGNGSGVTGIGSVVGAAGWVDPGAIVYQSNTTDLVGIGTTNPSTTFEIVQQSTNPALMISSVFNGDGNLMIVHSGGNVGIGTTQPIAKTVIENTGAIDSFRINDITADSSPFVIDQNGNVGIGTSTVGRASLVIRGTTAGTGAANFFTTDSSNNVLIQGFDNGSMGIGNISAGAGIGIGTWAPSARLEIAKAGGGVEMFMVSSTATGDGDYFKVNDLGNVGIGTNTPLGALVVYSGNTGLGTLQPGSRLTVRGGAAFGSSSAYTSLAAPTDGLMVEGRIGIGTFAPKGVAEIIIGSNTTPIFMISSTATAQGDELTVSSVGNVGIGTSNPGSALSVGGGVGIGNAVPYKSLAAPAAGLMVEGNVGIGTFVPGGSLEVIITASTIPFLISSAATANGDEFVVTSAGNVGIGTTGPNAQFVVAAGNVGIGTTNPVNGTSIMNGNVGIGTWSPSSRFQVNTPTTTPFVIEDSGEVGVGTTTPVGGMVVMNGNVGIGTWSPTGKFVVATGNVGIGTTIFTIGGMNIMNGNVGIGTWNPVQNLDVRGAGRFAGTGDTYLNAGGGNVGIGSAAPSGFKLDINGTVRSTSTTDIGWTVVNAANQACNTTCTSACVVGIDTGSTTSAFIACSGATADSCLCAGAN